MESRSEETLRAAFARHAFLAPRTRLCQTSLVLATRASLAALARTTLAALASTSLACAPGEGPPPAAPVSVTVRNVEAGAVVAAPSTESPPSGDPTSVGTPVQVEWRGTWWPAVVLGRRAEGWLVHYDGYGEEWDEVVDTSRIRPAGAGPTGREPTEALDAP